MILSHFTKQERLVLGVLALVLFIGSLLRISFKMYPSLKDATHFIDSERVYHKFNLNKVTAEELETIPYIGKYTSQNIIQYRQQNGSFITLDQLKQVKGIRNKNYEKFIKYLKVGKND